MASDGLYMNEPSSAKTSKFFFIGKKKLYAIMAALVVLFIVVIIITHYASSSKSNDCSANLNPTTMGSNQHHTTQGHDHQHSHSHSSPGTTSVTSPSAMTTTSGPLENTCANYVCNNLDKFIAKCPAQNNGTHSSETDEHSKEKLNYRLPRSLKPYRYEMMIKPYFKATQAPEYYQASVLIKFTCLQNTSKLILHKTSHIQIDKQSFEVLNLDQTLPNFIPVRNLDSPFFIDRWYYEAERNFFVVEFAKELFVAGHNYSVFIGFNGTIKDDNNGFYRSSYSDENGHKRYLMVSDFEPTDARKAFVCFDEPEMKARFQVTIIHDPSLNAISNMPVKSQTILSSYWTKTEFHESVEMSTYLFALLVSDFRCAKSVAKPRLSKWVYVSVCARPNAYEQIEFALNASVKILEFFEDYYNVEYPLPKLDHIALPDFNSGAMENWGLITYRESRLLYDKRKASQSAEQDIVEVIAHEIAHQWFGNLVTMKWWNDLWLNEGFARFMQFVGTSAVRPQWNMDDQIMSVVFSAMQLDSVSTSHAISVEVNNPTEITEIFDSITYGKGGSVIRMMNYFLGDSVFKSGLTEYLEKYKYSNAHQQNLWDSLAQVGYFRGMNVNLTNVMNSWTKQMGHPVVNVKVINKTHISINQEHFLLNADAKPSPSIFNYKWYVPFTHTIESSASTSASSTASKFNISNIHENIIWLRPEEHHKVIKLERELGDNDYLLANLDSFGFFRINYDLKNWNAIRDQLIKNKLMIPTRMRSQIINDIFGLAQSNRIDAIKPFDLIKYMSASENEYLPWSVCLGRINFYVDMLESTELYGSFKNYLLNLIEPVYNRITWNDQSSDTWLTGKLRTRIIRFACLVGLPDCVDKARNLYAQWMKNENENKIPQNYRSFVYCVAIMHGSDAEWQFASEQYDREINAVSRRELQYGMSCTRQIWLQIRFLNDQLNKTKVRVQDTISGIYDALSNLYASSTAFNFVKNNWKTLIERYGHTYSLSYLIDSYAGKINNAQQYNDFNNFFSKTEQKAIARQFKVSSELAKSNVKWLEKNYQHLKKWLLTLGSQSATNTDKINYRLPMNLKPFVYDLTVKPYIGTSDEYGNKSFTFDGIVNVTYQCVEPTNRIVLHELELIIHRIKIYSSSSGNVQVSMNDHVQHDSLREFLIVSLNSNCLQGQNYTLEIVYSGKLTDMLAGFYRSTYYDENKILKYVAVTHFEPTDARRAFPCFDEPALKAEFKITIHRHKNFSNSLSNMPLERTELDDSGDWFIDHFRKSVPMSTYLVAFAVSNFKSVKKLTSKYNVEIEVAARPEAIDKGHGAYALQEASEIIDYYSEYFDTVYPLPKSTQIALPDFNAGAMENWGLITYREKYLLYNPNFDSIFSKRYVTVVVAHELAHQWFGNLVSPQWWNDLWLNEGFASWVEYLGTNRTHPEWQELEFFFRDKIESMVKDSLETSHAINTEVNNPAEINSLFDAISYDKGSSLIRMMNSFLSMDTFRRGINKYLKKYQMGNARQDDLWQELSNQAHLENRLDRSVSLKTIMDTWTLKKGYPLVTVTRTVNHLNKSLTLRMRQNWFRLDAPASSDNDTYRWYVPFTFTLKSHAEFSFESVVYWLKPHEREITINIPYLDDLAQNWIVGNIKHSGYYRVNYDLDNWNLLIRQLKSNYERIDVVNRAALIDDAFNLVKAGYLEQTLYLDLISYLVNETHSLPFDVVAYGLGFIGQMLSQNYTTFKLYQNFCHDLYKRSYEELAWNASLTDITKIYLQMESMNIMCTQGDSHCIEKARQLFFAWINFNQSIPNNFRNLVVRTAIKYGDEQLWLRVFEMAQNSTVQSEKLILLRALTRTRDYNLLKFLLQKTMDKSLVRPQDQPTLIKDISWNRIGRAMVWDYLVENWNEIVDTFGSYAFTLTYMINDVMSTYNSKYELENLENLLRVSMQSGKYLAVEGLKEAIQNVKSNINWMNGNFEAVSAWLHNYKSSKF